MSTSTKRTLIISIITMILATTVLSFLWYDIKKKSLALDKQVEILRENNSKELAYLNINRTVKDTQEDRNSINSRFFKSTDDTIYFLNEIEALAKKFGLDFETIGLDDVEGENKKIQAVNIIFKYSGDKENVIEFTKLIENIPYHAYAETLSLHEITGNIWQGEISIFVTVQSS